MVYTPTAWLNGDSGGTPLNKDNLNHLEQGVKTLDNFMNLQARGLYDPTGEAVATTTLVQQATNQIGVSIRGATGATRSLLNIEDSTGNSIAYFQPSGGLGVVDHIYTTYSTLGPKAFDTDIYGFTTYGPIVEMNWKGAPGNMLGYTDAAHEVYDGTRALSVGNWTGLSGSATIATFAGDPTLNVTRNRGALRVTNTNGSGAGTISQPSTTLGIPVVASTAYSFVFSIKQISAATNRTVSAQVVWYNSGGSVISTSTQTAASCTFTTSPGQVYAYNPTSPALAAFATCQIVINSQLNEVHEVCGAKFALGTHTAYAPPFVQRSGQSLAGDRWWNSNTPSTSNTRLYICTTGGVPSAQVWSGIL